jgi:hypothetical protein
MRLKEVLQQPALRNAGIAAIGTYKTGKNEFIVLAHHGEPLLPIPKLFHLIENGPSNPDPHLDPAEIDTIYRRLLKISYL